MSDLSSIHPTDRSPLRIDVALTPDAIAALPPAARPAVAIVVDVVRATTTLAVLFERGCHQVIATETIDAARSIRAELAPAALLAGEAGGLPPAGFDFGNSPAEFARHDVRERELVFVTTNGTQALAVCAAPSPTHTVICAGAYRNAGAAASFAVERALERRARSPWVAATVPDRASARPSGLPSEAPAEHRACDIIVVCSGRVGFPAFDDTICAGYLVQRVREVAVTCGSAVQIAEGARIAEAAWATVATSGEPLRDVLASTDAGQSTLRVGLDADLAFCAEIDATDVAPYVVDVSRDPLRLTLRAAHAVNTACTDQAVLDDSAPEEV